MIRLVCIDVDGTLIGASGTVHDAVWEAVTTVRDAGIRLAICSGRPGFGITRELALRIAPDAWHSFQNGASVVSFAEGSLSEPLPADAVRMLVDRARRAVRALELYTDEDYVVETDTDRAARHAALLGVPFRPRPFVALDGTIVRGQWLVAREDADAVLAESYPGLEVSPSLAPTMPDTQFVNLTREGVNKGRAVRAIAARHEIDLADVMFVGDGFNDVSALEIVGHPVAMRDAEPEALAAATTIVADADSGGLADALHLALEHSAGGT